MKKIVIGIDVSKEKLDVTAMIAPQGESIMASLGYEVFSNSKVGFMRMINWSKKLVKGTVLADLLFCCETTGSYDRLLCNCLYLKGVSIWRESALQIKSSMGVRKGKDDKADSRAIAEYAIRHMDKAKLYQPEDANIRKLKALLLDRSYLVKQKTAEKVRATSIKQTQEQDEVTKHAYRSAMKRVRALDKDIRHDERLMKEIMNSCEELKQSREHLDSVKGLGLVNQVAMIAYTNNFKDFKTARQMASYWGVASFRIQSGTSIDHRANVKHLSNSMLKSYITQAAECTIQEGGIYRDYYLRLRARGKVHGVVVNNIKNKLIHLAFTLVKTDCNYECHHEELRKLSA